jgi:hypothetical protein
MFLRPQGALRAPAATCSIIGSHESSSPRLGIATTHHKLDVEPVVCGPSNVGNSFAAHGIDATCGFGVTYENLHAPNERTSSTRSR